MVLDPVKLFFGYRPTVEPAEQADDLAEDPEGLPLREPHRRVDRIIRDQKDRLGLLRKALEDGLVPEKRHDDVPGGCGRLPAHDNDVTTGYGRGHAVARGPGHGERRRSGS